MRNRQLWIVIVLVTASVCVQAQWLKHPAGGTPRTRNGEPNLKAPSKPFSFKFTKLLLPDPDLLESYCENEKDAARLLG